MRDGNSIKWFERLNKPKGFTVFLYDAEPARAIRRIGGFVNFRIYLSANLLANLVVNAWWNREVFHDPGLMRDGRHIDRWKEIFAKMSAFGVVPRERVLVYTHKMMH